MLDKKYLAERLAVLNTQIKMWNAAMDELFQERFQGGISIEEAIKEVQQFQHSELEGDHKNPIDDLFEELDQLCNLYLQASSEDRFAIRLTFEGKRSILNELYKYMGHVAKRIKTEEDTHWLRMALVAAAIDDGRTDQRDLLIALGDVYLAASRAGIDPNSKFKSISALCASPGRSDMGSTRHLLANFQETAYFKESVAPKL